ncbi:putative porin [Hoylesella oralis]|uniref:putative porin n=1 Tax=Hoylesella oralis TaxID=28134 RepID=UPI0028E24991|nr:putative porin [Hoylesella oralis]
MNRFPITLFFFITTCTSVFAQIDQFNQIDVNGNITTGSKKLNNTDSLGTDKEIPTGLKVWTVDRYFGDITPAIPDTVPHMYMNSIFTTGMRGEFNTTGNLGAPRINRIYADRPEPQEFIFTTPYDFFLKPVDKFHFTNTLSPFTNLSYNNAGNRTDGEDHFTAKFGVNAGKKIGVGFNFDYLYGRGYYSNQSTAHFNYTMYGSYIGDRYQAHLLLSTNHQKVTENGGITNDNYITHPESFDDNYATSEIPTVLSRNWNRNDNQHIFLTHRYSLGFNRKVPMTEEEIEARKFAIESKKENEARKSLEEKRKTAREEGRTIDEKEEQKILTAPSGRPDNAKIAGIEPAAVTVKPEGRIAINGKSQADSLNAQAAVAAKDTAWLKNEYVPVTSFIHTMSLDNYRRIYQAYVTPTDFYANTYVVDEPLSSDSIYDKTRYFRLKNIFAISLLEGFNKWAKAGLKAYASHELRHFVLPDHTGTATYNEHAVYVGGQLSKTQGHTLHYNVIGEFGVTGKDAGNIRIDGNIDLNFSLFGDTVQLAASGFFHNTTPPFYYRHYHARHFWWDNDDLNKTIHSRIQGTFSYTKTRTKLRIAVDELKNYAYFEQGYTINSSYNRLNNTVSVAQTSEPITVFTAQLTQDFTLGPLNWENVITYQKSSNQNVLPVPDLNIYTNLYLRFKIAHVLKCDFGADARYFTQYYAPDYSPALGQYAVQTNTDTSGGDSRVKIGNYPLVNVYANFHLKHTRFFVMYSHVNAGSGNKEYFLVPHYPLNERIFRFGVSWNFFN